MTIRFIDIKRNYVFKRRYLRVAKFRNDISHETVTRTCSNFNYLLIPSINYAREISYVKSINVALFIVSSTSYYSECRLYSCPRSVYTSGILSVRIFERRIVSLPMKTVAECVSDGSAQYWRFYGYYT